MAKLYSIGMGVGLKRFHAPETMLSDPIKHGSFRNMHVWDQKLNT